MSYIIKDAKGNKIGMLPDSLRVAQAAELRSPAGIRPSSMPIFPCRNWNALNFSHCALPGIFLRRWSDSAHHISPQPTTCARRTGGQAVRGCLGGGGPAGRILLLPAFFVFVGEGAFFR